VNSQVKSLRESLDDFSFAKPAKKIARSNDFSDNSGPPTVLQDKRRFHGKSQVPNVAVKP